MSRDKKKKQKEKQDFSEVLATVQLITQFDRCRRKFCLWVEAARLLSSLEEKLCLFADTCIFSCRCMISENNRINALITTETIIVIQLSFDMKKGIR